MKTFIRIRLQSALVTLFICFFSFSCQKNASFNNGSGNSSVHIYLTDDPSLVFDHVFLNIQKLEIKVEDNDQSKHESEHQGEADDNDHHGDNSGGWMNIAITPGVYDILKFRNGLDTLFAASSFVAVKQLKKVRLTLGSNNSVVLNGVNTPLITKDNDNIIVIKLDDSRVQVNSGGLTSLWIDIDAGGSVKQHGHDFEFKGQVNCFSKNKLGAIEGRVLPGDAAAVVMAIRGTDTANAKPEREGEFKFIGLTAGTYSLRYRATANNYIDTVISNIIINGKEDIKIPLVTLHK
ncbi:MAG: DUF4382 domain-containing protein [Bacteroidota bacterium]